MEDDPALAAYQRGENDVFFPNTDMLPAIESDPVLSRDLIKMPSPYVSLFNLNLTKEPFQDKAVREAFAYAFDRQAYCRVIEYDSCTPAVTWIPRTCQVPSISTPTPSTQIRRAALAASS